MLPPEKVLAVQRPTWLQRCYNDDDDADAAVDDDAAGVLWNADDAVDDGDGDADAAVEFD